MRKSLLLTAMVFVSIVGFSQDFSNKGKDFWVGYGYHERMGQANGGSQDMVLYFATDQVTNITITIPGNGYTQTITTAAGNNVVTSAIIPKTGAQDSRLLTEGVSNKGIHITSDKPMVAYAHVYNQSVSGATILYPTNTLGREYYSVNYKNWSNQNNANCWFYVVATDTGTTTVEITPTGTTTGGWVAGTTYTVTLTQGQIYNVMGALINSPNNCNPVCTGYDLTGSKVKSINNGTGCKKIAVFSGSGRISITCNNNGSSSDNYMVQAMPRNAWGKKYLTVPANGNQAYNFYRVCVTNPLTPVKINGVPTALPIQNGFYYEIPATNQPQLIESDSAIMVAQYFTSQGACGNGNNPGDPEVIYLSAVEQNINTVLWYATPNWQITTHSFHVVIPNTGTAVSSFKLDGVTQTGWVTHPQDANYVYLKKTIAAGPHLIQSDSGFNAIAYGFGNAESYGYNAGTNIKDLYQQIGVRTQYGIETTPSVCTNSPFKFKVSLPYIPDSMYWNFHNAAGMLPNNTNVFVNNTGNVAEDSITIVNGKTIHWYSIPLLYTFTNTGTYPITITTYVPNGECGSVQDIDFDLVVSNPPIADFSWTAGGCYAEPFQFTETTPQFPKPTYHFWWDFDDPASGANNTSGLRNPTHTFSAPGTYNVRFSDITTPGCLSDTIVHQVVVAPLPSATISGNATVCINDPGPVQITFTGSGGTIPYTFYYHINAGGAQSVASVAPSGTATINVPTGVAGTFVYTLDSVKNTGSSLCVQTITGQSVTIVVQPDATITLSSPAGTDNQTVCIDNAITPITYNIGGSGNGAVLSAGSFPAGVTGSYSGGVFTIQGTPTVSGVFPYTITTQGPCQQSSKSGVITVNANSTITLSSAPGTDNQTVCINNPIAPITYAVAAGGTGAIISAGALPAGVTGTFAAGVFTIQGTPTVSGVFNYTVTTTGPCINPSVSGTITVLANSTITLSSAPGTDNQTVCINNPIVTITYAVGGTGNGASITAGGLPTGVTGTYAAGVFTIQGTPTVSGVFPYTITTQGPCVNPTISGTITVTEDATITLSSAPGTDNQAVCRNTAIVPITYAVAGSGTGASVTAGGLPAGVTGTFAGGVFTIQGTPTVSGVFNYTVTTVGPCVNPSVSGTITVYALPTPNFTFNAPTCETRTITFTDGSVPNSGTLSTWAWDFGDPASGANNTSTLQNPTHIFGAAGTYNVTLTVTSSFGCISDPIANIPVTINERPQAGFIIPEVCLSDTYAQFLDTSHIAAPSTIVAWAWNFGDPVSGPNNTSTLQNPTHSYTAVGNYNVQLIVTTNTGCKDTIVQVLTVNGSYPTSIFTVNNPTTLCANDSVRVVNLSTVFPGVITQVEITWDLLNNPGVVQTDPSPFFGKIYSHLYPNFQSPLTKNFTIRFRAFSGGVCLDDSLQVITVNAAPKVQFNNMPDTCLLAAPFQLTQASEIGGVPGTGVFSGPGVSPTGIFSPAVAGIGLHTILYTFTSAAGGCVDTMSRTIRVLDTAHAVFTYSTPVCDGFPITFTDQSTAPGTVVLANTVWDFGDGSPIENHAPGSSFPHTFPAPGTYNVTMYNTSAYGCNSTMTMQQVTVLPNHTITLTSGPGSDNQTTCINVAINPITYNLGGGATGATVTGLPAGMTYAVVGTTLTISGAPTTTVGSPFNYSIVTTGNACTVANASGTVTVTSDHTITLTSGPGSNVQRVCLNTAISPITFDIGGGATSFTITGLPPGVTAVQAGNTITISGSPSSTAGTPYRFTITTAGNNCVKASDTGRINVSPYPVPVVSLDKSAYCIPNAIVKFINNSTIEDGTENAFTYAWDFGEPSSGASNTSVAKSPTHWYSGTGPFTVKLSITSLWGCVHDTTFTISTIHPQPKADFKTDTPYVCIRDAVRFTDNTDYKDGAPSQWNWSLGDGSIRNVPTFSYTYGDTITYNVTLYTVNSLGCNSDTITRPFTVYPYPHVNAGPDRVVLEGGTVQLLAVTWGNDMRYVWSPATYLDNINIERPRVYRPLTDMTYRLTVTARGNCKLSDDVFVKLLKFPLIPNTFTPNNDGINDKWVIEYLETYPDNRVQVFTRDGQLVFESRGYATPWDGTMKGKPLPVDTYYYIIEPGSGRDPITGYVTIIK